MKNIHLLPTDKSSRLSIKDGILILHRLQWRKGTHHIYITSDEEIKMGDWFMSDFNSYPLHNIKELYEREGTLGWKQKDLKNNLKIILTTDPDLIKDGVQEIDNEFLEWFVKNPSSEEVKIVNNWDYNNKGFVDHSGYKIIIPKEEVCSFCDGTGQVVSSTTISRFKTCDCKIIPKEEPKQETLEEAKKYAELSYYGDEVDAFVRGVKWQQEQDKKMYSEEDMLNFAWFLKENLGQYSCDRTAHFEGKYLEQFKKK